MNTALKLAAVALALGLVASMYVYWSIGSLRLGGARDAALLAGFPFVGIAVLALANVIGRRNQPAASLSRARVADLVTLLALSGVWSLFIPLIWGL
jgi:hypothetical protein